MKPAIRSTSVALLAVTLLGGICTAGPVPNQPELEYLKAVNQVGPPRDPQLLFILMGLYANANRQREGIEFFSARLQEFGARLSDGQKALYLGAVALLRAQYASKVSFFRRIGWVRDTIALLEEAKRRSGGEVFVVRWISGVISAQLPGFFGQRTVALGDLTWCVENADKAPHAGWLREVYYRLGSIAQAEGDEVAMQDYLRRSGYADFDRPITLTTPFAEDRSAGHTFSPKRLTQIMPGKVFALSGYEFTEYYFVVSDDGRELIGIDAGTRPDSAKDAYEALRAQLPDLPRVTTVVVTHAHWDHVGGHTYFRGLNPDLKFYARANYDEQIARESDAPARFAAPFFGERFRLEDVRSFTADVTIDRQTELRIGGTRIELIPIQGGETDDALLIHLPDHGVMFVGDFIMPYLGAPFVEEGSIDGLLDAIDVVVQKNPQYMLHGHEPLTRVLSSPAMLASLKVDLSWLREQTLGAIRRGDERAMIQQANLIPPGLLAGDPDVHLPYLLLRENVINRIYDQQVGYWQPDLQGVDYVSRADRGAALVVYLGVSEQRLAEAVTRMVADGQYELAASVLDWTRDRFPNSEPLAKAERAVYLKLMEKYQEFNPFKFIIYSSKIDESVRQMGAAAPEGE